MFLAQPLASLIIYTDTDLPAFSLRMQKTITANSLRSVVDGAGKNILVENTAGEHQQRRRPADPGRKYHIHHYRHIFVYLWDKMEKREENALQP